eukprot:PhM_4_TR9275/c0_g1_i1/m.64226
MNTSRTKPTITNNNNTNVKAPSFDHTHPHVTHLADSSAVKNSSRQRGRGAFKASDNLDKGASFRQVPATDNAPTTLHVGKKPSAVITGTQNSSSSPFTDKTTTKTTMCTPRRRVVHADPNSVNIITNTPKNGAAATTPTTCRFGKARVVQTSGSAPLTARRQYVPRDNQTHTRENVFPTTTASAREAASVSDRLHSQQRFAAHKSSSPGQAADWTPKVTSGGIRAVWPGYTDTMNKTYHSAQKEPQRRQY